MLLSSHSDSMDIPDSLSIHPYYPSLLTGPPNDILCPHSADVISSCWSANTGMSMCVGT